MLRRSLAYCLMIGLAATASAGAAESCASTTAFVLSPDARFLRVDLATLDIVDVGNLWWLDIHRVERVIVDPLAADLLIETPTWKLQGIEDPSRQQAAQHGVVALRVGTGGGLAIAAVVAPASEADYLAGAKAFEVAGERRLLVTFGDEQAARTRVIVHDAAYRPLQTLDDALVLARSCMSGDQASVSTLLDREPFEVSFLELASGKTSRRSVGYAGSKASFSHTAVAFAGDCRTLVYERLQRKDDAAILHLLNAATGEVLSKTRTRGYGDYFILGPRRLAMDEILYEPLLVDGEAVGMQAEKPGRLHLLDIGPNGQKRILQLPAGGGVAAVACDGRQLLHVSPRLLTLIDSESWQVIGSLKIPFENASVALLGTGG